MMEKDKELLLSVHPSDSDEVIEEFKLPPPRTRRPKSRKSHHVEPRIASHGSSIISWKCCLLFLLASLFISGILVLTYFMLNMQQQINQMDLLLSKATADIKRNSAANLVQKKIIAELDGNKQKFSKQDLNNKLLAHQLNQMNKTLKALISHREYEQQLKTLNRDVDSIKTGMASTGGDIAKLQAQTKANEAKLQTSVSELKSEINTLKELVHHLNQTLTENTQKIVTQVYNSNVEMDDKSNELEVMIKGVNLTLHDALAKTISSKANVENVTEAKSLMTNHLGTEMNDIKDEIYQLKLKVDKNNLVSDMALVESGLNNTREDINYLKLKVNNHHSLIEKMALVESGLNNTREDINYIRLKVNNHHSLMEKMELVENGLNNTRDEINNLKVELNNHHSLMEETISKVGNLTYNIKRIEHTRKVEPVFDVPVESVTTSNVKFVSTSPQVRETVQYTTAEPVIGVKVTSPGTLSNTISTNVSSSGLSNITSESLTKRNETFPTTLLKSTRVISTLNPINKTGINQGNNSITGVKGTESVLATKGNETVLSSKGNELVPKGSESVPTSKGNVSVATSKGNVSAATSKGNETVLISKGNESVTTSKGNEPVPTSALTEERIKDDEAVVGNGTVTGINGIEFVVPTSPVTEQTVTEQRIKDQPELCPLRCDKHESCLDDGGSYSCVCKEGFLRIGKSCEDNNECYNSVTVCHMNAICTNTIGSYSCQCDKGFQGDGTLCTLVSSENLNGATASTTASSQSNPNPTPANHPLVTQMMETPLSTDSLPDEAPFPTREMPDELGRYPDPNGDVVATPEGTDTSDEDQDVFNPSE